MDTARCYIIYTGIPKQHGVHTGGAVIGGLPGGLDNKPIMVEKTGWW